MKKSYKELILFLVSCNSGKINWYHCEREFMRRGISHGLINTGKIAMQLEQEHDIQFMNNKDNVECYDITDQGKQHIKQLIDQKGIEWFQRSDQDPDDYLPDD